MVFILLNFILFICFIFLTYYIDKKGNLLGNSGNTLLVPLLFACVELFVYMLVMIFNTKFLESLTINLIRIIYCLDGIFFVSFSYGLVGIANRVQKPFAKIVQWLLYIFAVYIAFFQFTDISIGADLSMNVSSAKLFSGEAQKYFAWDWVFVFNAIYKFIIPGTAFLFLMVFQERRGSQLQKYQSIVIAEGIALMWMLMYFFNYIGKVQPAYNSLYMYS